MSKKSAKPRVESGYDFDGTPIKRVTFDLRSPDYSEQIDRFLAEHFGDAAIEDAQHD